MIEGFRWHDGERLIRFGRGALADAPGLLGDGYVLLRTSRTIATAQAIADHAERVLEVRTGNVDEIAAELEPQLADVPRDRLLVALGGGRVIDVAKALAAVRAPARTAAIPTTLSAAEMTPIHRLPAGADPGTPLVRPAVVLNDPALCASQPEPELAASAANALGHAIEGPLTPLSSPVPELAAAEAVRLIGGAYAEGATLDRDALALAALLSGYAIGSSGYGLHHVASQTLVRLGGIWHGHANAALLPHSIAALRHRAPDRIPAGAEELATRLAALAGASSLSALGLDADTLPAIAQAASQRPQLRWTPPAADPAELLALYRAAL